jgi:Flp pilus assembly protein TadG
MDNQKNSRSQRGAMIVEAALILPLLLLLTFGGLKYGWLFIKWQQITNCSRYIARIAVLPGDRSEEINTALTRLMAQANIPVTSDTLTIAYPDGSADVGKAVEVTISVPVDSIDILKIGKPGGIVYLPTPKTLSARMTMSKEGP